MVRGALNIKMPVHRRAGTSGRGREWMLIVRYQRQPPCAAPSSDTVLYQYGSTTRDVHGEFWGNGRLQTQPRIPRHIG